MAYLRTSNQNGRSGGEKIVEIIFNNFSIFHQILQSMKAVREDRGVHPLCDLERAVWRGWQALCATLARALCASSTVVLCHTVLLCGACHTFLWCSESTSTVCLKHYLAQVLCSASTVVCHTSSVPQKYYCVPHSLSSLLLPLCAAETWPVKWRGAGKGF